jgi:predicted protein tyrosine phosphatase/cytoskeletal protein CcmA (bactofilin family)
MVIRVDLFEARQSHCIGVIERGKTVKTANDRVDLFDTRGALGPLNYVNDAVICLSRGSKMPLADTRFTITICGLKELAGHADRQVSHVLSILEPDQAEPEAFGAYGEHARLELKFHDIIQEMPGFIAPQPDHISKMLEFGRDLLSHPENVRHLLVHCHAGISRSTAAMTLLLAQAQPDLSAADVLAQVVRVRSKAWPNLRILALGEEQLGRKGEFTRAVGAVYRRQLEQRPEIESFFLDSGRAWEIQVALAKERTATPFPDAAPSNLSPIAVGRSLHSTGDSNISDDLTIIGDVSSKGSVTVDGTIEGNIYCTSLVVTANGRINGGIVANHEVTVQGQVNGTIRGKRVMLQASAKVEGDIFHQGIGIEMGTRYDGTLRWTEDERGLVEPLTASHSKNRNGHAV